MIKKILKKIPLVLIIKNNFRIKKDYLNDYKMFKNNWIQSFHITNNKLGYSIILETHSIEKGMTSKNARRFGIAKVKKIIECLNNYQLDNNDKKDYFYRIGYGTLKAYCEFYENHNWIDSEEYLLAKKYIDNYHGPIIPVGVREILKEDFINNAKINYDSFLSSRHSIREFESKRISEEDFNKAVKMALKTPTACNRQMCKIYYLKNEKLKSQCIKYGHGLTNFDIDSCNFFFITFDISSFCYSGDRHQGWLNTGLVAMNFVNAFHSLGIGTCFIQYGNDFREEEEMKKLLSVPKNEKIALIIVGGYYKDKSIIPFSTRKDFKDISSIIK